MNKPWIVLFVLAVAGCASKVPVEIRTAPVGSPSVSEARADTERFVGSEVRWGGSIAKVENRAGDSLIEVIDRKLKQEGRPAEEGDHSGGRFLVRVSHFVDPLVFEQGRLITVTGVLAAPQIRLIGEYPYRYPVVAARSVYLWEPEKEWRYEYPPYWYYDPWYPYPWHYPPYYWY